MVPINAVLFVLLVVLFFHCQQTEGFSTSLKFKSLRALPLQRKASPLQFSFDDIGVGLYDAQLTVSTFVDTQLATPNPASFAFLYAAGLLTAFSPCSISLIPLTLAYLGGNEATNNVDSSNVVQRSLSYAAGLATSLTLFGLSAAMLGNVFGSSGLLGDASGLLSSALFLAMGLYLLEIIRIDFPTIATNRGNEQMSKTAQSFLFGATSALVASPCSSPVLTSLLAVVATSGDASVGAAFLFAYSLGYATPVVVASAASGSALSRLFQSGGASWANPAFASLLISYGTYSAFDNVAKILNVYSSALFIVCCLVLQTTCCDFLQ